MLRMFAFFLLMSSIILVADEPRHPDMDQERQKFHLFLRLTSGPGSRDLETAAQDS